MILQKSHMMFFDLKVCKTSHMMFFDLKVCNSATESNGKEGKSKWNEQHNYINKIYQFQHLWWCCKRLHDSVDVTPKITEKIVWKCSSFHSLVVSINLSVKYHTLSTLNNMKNVFYLKQSIEFGWIELFYFNLAS